MSRKIMVISVHGDPLAGLGGIQSGGQNVYVNGLTKALDKLGWQLDVFTHWDRPSDPEVESLGCRSRVIRLAAGFKGFLSKNKLFNYLPAFVEEVKSRFAISGGYCLIHSNYWLSGWVGRRLKLELGLPQVHTSHSLGMVRKEAVPVNPDAVSKRLAVEREVLRGSDKVIATTPEESVRLCSGYGVPAGNIRVIPCGIDPSLFNPGDRREAVKRVSSEGRKVILFVGRFEANKGLEVLLASLRFLGSYYPRMAEQTRLWIIGGDPVDIAPEKVSPQKKHYLQKINKWLLTDLVKFFGQVSQKELPLFYRAAEVTVVPSYYESFGLVAVEAMACGCPVIVSRVGGLKYTVQHGLSGLTVPPRNPEQMAAALNCLLSSDILRRKMSEKAAVLVRGKFNWPRVAREVDELYREVLGWKQRLGWQTTALH